MKYIVAYTPFSKEGEKAAGAAYYIAKQLKATLLLIDKKESKTHVKSRVLLNTANDSFILEENIEQNSFNPADFIDMLQADDVEPSNVKVECICKDDLSERNSDGKILTREIGLIVSYVDNHDHSSNDYGEEEFFRPLQKAGCPILTLDGQHSLENIRKIGYITDLRYCDIGVLCPLIDLFRPFDVEWIVIHVSASGLPDIENEYAEKLFTTQILPRLNYRKAILINLFGKDILNDLKNVAKVLKPDMIALPSNKYWCYGRLFPGTAETKPGYSEIPLLFGR